VSTILSILFGGVTVAILNHYMGIKREIDQHQRERKEKQYRSFLKNLIGFFDGWEDKDKQRKFMEELQTNAFLYASKKVILLAQEYAGSFNDGSAKSGDRDKIANRLRVAVREEMGIDIEHPLGEDEIKLYKLNG